MSRSGEWRVTSGEKKQGGDIKSPLQGKGAGLKPGLYREKSERDG